MIVRLILAILIVLMGCKDLPAADEIDLRFVVITNDGSDFEVKIQCNRNNANWDRLGSSNFPFFFNTLGIDNPTLQVAHNFSGGNYNPMTVTDNGSWASVNIDFNGANGEGTAVPTSWTDVATVHFDVIDPGLMSNLVWRTDGAYAGYDDDEMTWLDPGSFSGLDVTLPVELASFSARCTTEGVLLEWVTESETENAGYLLDRQVKHEATWTRIASYETHETLQGQGNCSYPTEYAYTDAFVIAGTTYRYRLSDVDLKGKKTVQDEIEITVTEVVIPESTVLQPAYPNPFNPETRIGYRLSKDTAVSLEVIDMKGLAVCSILKNVWQKAGNYHVFWNGRLDSGRIAPSGTYVLVLQADDLLRTQKVMLVR